MTKHSVTVTVDTDDNKALRMLLNLSRDVGKGSKELRQFLRPVIRQLGRLQGRIENALLDLDTPLEERR
jgi:hypothetical protein